MTALAYDPKTKLRIRDAIYDHLYGPAEEKFQRRLEQLIKQNTSIYRNTQPCFKYKGEVYTLEPGKIVPRPTNWLDQSLYADMEAYLSDVNEMKEDELPYVMGYLNKVLNASDSFQDYYKLFPEAIHPVLRKLENSCPCRNDLLDDKTIEKIRNSNVIAIRRIKRRMTLNLLL